MSIKIVKENVVVNISSAGVQGMKGEKGDPYGTSGTAGTSGTSGETGSSGTSGIDGSSGTSGLDGSSGSSGSSGISGSSGLDGTFFGSHGTSGTSGSHGSSGVSGTNSSAGTSGTTGSHGTSATAGSGGTSGVSGTNGSAGTSGTAGSAGTSGTRGSSGTSGSGGSSGTSGLTINYKGTSTDTIDFTNLIPYQNYTLTTSTGLDYSVAQHVIVAHSLTEHFHGDVVSYNSSNGQLVLYVTDTSLLSGTYSTWTTNLDGAAGGDGTSGTSGFSIDSGSFVTTASFNEFTASASGANIADFTFTSETISNNNITLDANNDITLQTSNGDIILNADGGVYIGSTGGGNSIVTGGYLDSVIGDTNTVNNGTGHTITDNLTNIINSIPTNYATTGSNVFSGSQFISGSLVPSTGIGTFTSSFSLGSPTNAWKDLYLSQGSIIFVDAITQATSSFSIDDTIGGNAVKYSSGVTASYYLGDGGGLYNLPSTTNWKYNKEYTVKKTEQLTFSGDYIVENSLLVVEGSTPNSIGQWTFETWDTNGTYTQTANNQYTITGPTGNTNASIGIWMHRQFDTTTTVSIDYVWNGEDVGNDWPIYAVDTQYPYEIDTQNRLIDRGATSETGTWTINVPSGSWLSIGVNTANVNASVGTLQITLPYIANEDSVQYTPNKYFKKEGTIFIGGNLLVKDSTIENNGKISVGGEVILIGNSQITGTGTII